MNSKAPTHRRYLHRTLLVATLALLTLGFRCNIEIPRFPGITVLSSEQLIIVTPLGSSSMVVPVPHAPNRGTQIGPAFEPNTGNASSFIGTTDEFGVDRHTDARTNADWQVCVGPTASPPCFEGCIGKHVPTQGAIFQLFCVITS